MRYAFIAASLILLVVNPLFSQQLRPRDAVPPQRPVLDMVEGFYVSQLLSLTEMTDEQFVKVLPPLRQSLRERFDLSAQRSRLTMELRQSIERGGSDQVIGQLVYEMDNLDADIQASRQKFLAAVDPLLTVRQQAQLRIALITIEQRVGNMVQRATGAAPNR